MGALALNTVASKLAFTACTTADTLPAVGSSRLAPANVRFCTGASRESSRVRLPGPASRLREAEVDCKSLGKPTSGPLTVIPAPCRSMVWPTRVRPLAAPAAGVAPAPSCRAPALLTLRLGPLATRIPANWLAAVPLLVSVTLLPLRLAKATGAPLWLGLVSPGLSVLTVLVV